MGEKDEVKDVRIREYYPGFRLLNTWVKEEVFNELQELAKSFATVKGGWDYGNTIRELLWAKKVFWNINTRLDELELENKELRAMLLEKQAPRVEEKKKKKSELLGKHHLGGKKDGKK